MSGSKKDNDSRRLDLRETRGETDKVVHAEDSPGEPRRPPESKQPPKKK
jgi:hypothetical protein